MKRFSHNSYLSVFPFFIQFILPFFHLLLQGYYTVSFAFLSCSTWTPSFLPPSLNLPPFPPSYLLHSLYLAACSYTAFINLLSLIPLIVRPLLVLAFRALSPFSLPVLSRSSSWLHILSATRETKLGPVEDVAWTLLPYWLCTVARYIHTRNWE